jgi:hypothetical protein
VAIFRTIVRATSSQASIIADGERLVLPTSKDVSTWLEHGYDTLVHNGGSRLLNRLLRDRR